MTHNSKTYNLSINSKDPVGTDCINITATSSMPSDLLRLLQLSGQGNNTVYCLNIADQQSECEPGVQVSSNSNTTVTSSSAQDVAHVLAGEIQSCGEQDFAIMEQQAEYDYGHSDPTEDGHQFDLKDYNFKGRADLPERLTSARFGSNPLKSEMEESAFLKLKSKYEEYLEESRENEAGLDSPLTANSRDEFEHDPLRNEEPVDDGSRSPLSRIERQTLPD